MSRVISTSKGYTVTIRNQEQIPWKYAKRLMRLKDGATAEDLEFALAVMIQAWSLSHKVPTVNSDGTVNSNGLDELTSGEVNEIALLVSESNNQESGK